MCSNFHSLLWLVYITMAVIAMDEVTHGIKIGATKSRLSDLGSLLSNDLPESPTELSDRSLIPLLVPDPQLLSRDRLIGSRHKPIAQNSTEFQHEEDVMADTRNHLREMLREQRKREQNLNYLFMHKDRLESPTFEDNLVARMKKMKRRVHHLLDLEHDADAKAQNN